MTWHLGEMAPFDTESTGTDVENDRIVSATVARIRPGKPVDVHSHLIAVDVDIPQAATDVHGITTEHARANGQPAGVVLDQVAGALADAMLADVPVVGSNLAFDFTLLDRECRRHGVSTVEQRLGRPIGPVVDVFVIDKALDRFRPGKRQLDALCQQYGVRLDGAHDAEADALGAARVAYRIGQRAQRALAEPLDVMDMYSDRRYPENIVRGFQEFGKLTLAEVHAAQVGWYAEQAEGLAQYWRRQANELEYRAQRTQDEAERAKSLDDVAFLRERADSVTTDWPIRPYGGAR
ncbi:exonuclease domain-containing protein [Micromonospora sp. FIMYZ51]|uniref:exonuclease domain-containing protein n=1 Tax=Micromonospora sp. FIMYZ51 TaxID=3051832 RepID=UPI00311FD700